MSLILRNVSHSYHKGTPLETAALRGVSLDVEPGQWVAVVGHTGSGKSTLAQHLNALLLPDAGEITVDGLKAAKGSKDLREIRRRVGLVFQYPEQQLFAESVDEEMAFGPRNWGLPPDQIGPAVDQALALVDLADLPRDRSPFALSGGQKRRLAIASVLSVRPSYLVLDEPTAGLDSRGRRGLMTLIDGLRREGIAVVQVTHDLELALAYCDRICVLERGRALFWGTPQVVVEQLLDRPVLGLSLPEVLAFARDLREKGFNVPLSWDPHEVAHALAKEVG